MPLSNPILITVIIITVISHLALISTELERLPSLQDSFIWFGLTSHISFKFIFGAFAFI